MLYPLTFQPIFKERIWGGRNLERLYHKRLPPDVSIGEAWEITDRAEGVSVIANGPLAGKDLRWLMEHHAEELLGSVNAQGGRFPLLMKILDAQEKLSLQVHPPADIAARLGGEPKTEMWYVAAAQPNAELYVGLRRGVTRAGFERDIRDGVVAGSVHRVAVRTGDAMFLPSGRVHAIGAGLVIFEIQQNSDTTYRVFDWNRTGANGQPRELHVSQSLQCIDFNDFEPAPSKREIQMSRDDGFQWRSLVENPLFAVNLIEDQGGHEIDIPHSDPEIIGVLEGTLMVNHGDEKVILRPGEFCLKPASCQGMGLISQGKVRWLQIKPRDKCGPRRDDLPETDSRSNG